MSSDAIEGPLLSVTPIHRSVPRVCVTIAGPIEFARQCHAIYMKNKNNIVRVRSVYQPTSSKSYQPTLGVKKKKTAAPRTHMHINLQHTPKSTARKKRHLSHGTPSSVGNNSGTKCRPRYPSRGVRLLGIRVSMVRINDDKLGEPHTLSNSMQI